MSLAPSTLAGWIMAVTSSGTFVTVLTMALRYRLGMRKLDIGERGDIRDHYANEVKTLREKLNTQEEHFRNIERYWREMLEDSDRRHEECEEARRELRREIDKMHDEIRGLNRQITELSTDKLLILEKQSVDLKPSDIAPHSVAAAHRAIVRRTIDEGEK